MPNEESFKQGNTYNESGMNEEVGMDEEELNEENPQDKKSKKNLVIMGGILSGILLFALIGVLMSIQSKKAKDQADFLLEEEETVPVFSYSQKETEDLRLAGFTGTEIENYELEEKDSTALIADAKAKREEDYKKEILPYFNSASKEFKQLWSDTWLGGKELKVSKKIEEYGYFNTIINADYEKLPARGYQLFIKFYLENGSSCFMLVKPERYLELKKKGNIVLNIEYTETADGSQIITNIVEVEQ